MMDTIRLTATLKQRAHSLGFELTGACPAVSPEGIAPLARWLEAGYAGEMMYLLDRQSAYEHPRHVMSGVRSLLMLGTSYMSNTTSSTRAGEGRVASYAANTVDYHDDIHKRLKQLSSLATELRPGIRTRGVVDTAPLLEREFAQLAGLGWVGKNTMLLSRQQGSWFFLSALLLDCELDYDPAMQTSYCGKCTACLDACPTQAFPEPYVLDATRCISYLTIELRDPIPHDLRPGVGSWLFGCDVCQDVCPWNRKAARNVSRHSDYSLPSLHALLQLSDEAFRERFRHTAFWRSRRRVLLRNAAIVLGNQASPESHAALTHALRDVEPLVRGAAAWALGQIATEQTFQTLANRLPAEQDPEVRDEIARALGKRTRVGAPPR